MAGKRAIRLRTTHDVSRLLGKTINALMRDEISGQKSAKIGYLANILLRSLEVSDLEARLEALERTISENES